MTIIELIQPTGNAQYYDIHDDGFAVKRKMWISDKEGNTIILKDKEIGELFDKIKPPMMG